jgi:hypothetical protein
MVTRYFQRVDNTEQPVALFRLVVEPLAQTIEETQWETNVGWVGTDRLVAYLIDGSPIVDEVDERTAMRSFPDAFVSRVAKVTIAKHLAGKHDQSAHGRGGGMGAPREESRAKQKLAWELHEQGLTWEQVAQKAGYANSGAARLAGKAHEKRLKDKGDKPDTPDTPDPKKPDEIPTVTPSTAVTDAQKIIDDATGGKPLKDELTNIKGSLDALDNTVTQRELELCEEVVKAGAVLRGEVQRRIDLAGGGQLREAQREIEPFKRDLKKTEDAKRGKQEQEAELKREILKHEDVPAVIEETITKRTDDVLKYGYRRHQMEPDVVRFDIEAVAEISLSTSPKYIADSVARQKAVLKIAKQRYPGEIARAKRYASDIDGISDRDVISGLSRRESALITDSRLKGKFDELSDVQRDIRLLSDESWEISKQMRPLQRIVDSGGISYEERTRITIDVLKESGRTFSRKPSQPLEGTKRAQEECRDEIEKIPDELWNRTRPLKVRISRSRGHYDGESVVTDGEGERRRSTWLHELTHGVEAQNPSVKHMEFIMFHRRGKGEKPQKLQKLFPGSGYRRDEVAVKDEWRNAYSGKSYGQGRGASREIMTMGIEALMAGNSSTASRADDDHLNFVMGVLAFA